MHVLITGASKGIGKEISLQFSTMKNIHLYLISRSSEMLLKLREECLQLNPGIQVHAIPFDLSQLRSSPLPLPDSCTQIDILINNAGSLINKSFEDLSEEDIEKMIAINYLAPIRLTKFCSKLLKKAKLAHVVNIGSMGGFQGSAKFSGLSVYSSTKAALASLTECLAAEYSGSNIVFNCLALGAAQTEMLEEAFPGYKAPLSATQMAEFIKEFTLNGHKYMNGKIIPVSLSTP